MQIEILSVEVKTVPTPKGSYQMAELAFKNHTFQGKVEGRKLMSFGAAANTFKALSVASPGSVWNVTTVKNDKGFIDWVSAERGVAGAPEVPNTATQVGQTSYGAAKPVTAPVRSSYETPEERAQRQVLIVRQSSLSTAADVLTTGAKTPPKSEEVIALAKEFEQYVFGVKPELSGFDNMVDDSAEVM